jgi:ribonucleotide reductase beta subunit family protein with ferritin-like domain
MDTMKTPPEIPDMMRLYEVEKYLHCHYSEEINNYMQQRFNGIWEEEVKKLIVRCFLKVNERSIKYVIGENQKN